MARRQREERRRIARHLDRAVAARADQRELLAERIAVRRAHLPDQLGAGARGGRGDRGERAERLELRRHARGDQPGTSARTSRDRRRELVAAAAVASSSAPSVRRRRSSRSSAASGQRSSDDVRHGCVDTGSIGSAAIASCPTATRRRSNVARSRPGGIGLGEVARAASVRSSTSRPSTSCSERPNGPRAWSAAA